MFIKAYFIKNLKMAEPRMIALEGGRFHLAHLSKDPIGFAANRWLQLDEHPIAQAPRYVAAFPMLERRFLYDDKTAKEAEAIWHTATEIFDEAKSAATEAGVPYYLVSIIEIAKHKGEELLAERLLYYAKVQGEQNRRRSAEDRGLLFVSLRPLLNLYAHGA